MIIGQFERAIFASFLLCFHIFLDRASVPGLLPNHQCPRPRLTKLLRGGRDGQRVASHKIAHLLKHRVQQLFELLLLTLRNQ